MGIPLLGKKKDRIIIELTGTGRVVGDGPQATVEDNSFNVKVETRLDKGVGMLFNALMDVAVRFRDLHDRQPKPCPCLAIRYANIILMHGAEINEEMATLTSGLQLEDKKNKENDRPTI